MAEVDASKKGPLPNESEKPKYSEDVEDAKISTSIKVNSHESDAVDLPNDEVVVPGNEEYQQMSDPSRRIVSATTGMTSQVCDWASPGDFDVILNDVDMDPSVAIASSARWADGNVSSPSDKTLHQLGLDHLMGDDSQMNLNDVNMDPSVAIAAGSGLGDNVDGPSGETLQASGNDRTGAPVRGMFSTMLLVKERFSTVLWGTPGPHS